MAFGVWFSLPANNACQDLVGSHHHMGPSRHPKHQPEFHAVEHPSESTSRVTAPCMTLKDSKGDIILLIEWLKLFSWCLASNFTISVFFSSESLRPKFSMSFRVEILWFRPSPCLPCWNSWSQRNAGARHWAPFVNFWHIQGNCERLESMSFSEGKEGIFREGLPPSQAAFSSEKWWEWERK